MSLAFVPLDIMEVTRCSFASVDIADPVVGEAVIVVTCIVPERQEERSA